MKDLCILLLLCVSCFSARAQTTITWSKEMEGNTMVVRRLSKSPTITPKFGFIRTEEIYLSPQDRAALVTAIKQGLALGKSNENTQEHVVKRLADLPSKAVHDINEFNTSFRKEVYDNIVVLFQTTYDNGFRIAFFGNKKHPYLSFDINKPGPYLFFLREEDLDGFIRLIQP